MNTQQDKRPETLSSQAPGMKKPLGLSLGIHAAVILLAIIGLPHIARETPPVQTISVELLPISELTTTNRAPVKAPPKEKKEKEPPPPPKEELKKPPPSKSSPPPEPEKVQEKAKEAEPEKVEKAEVALPKKEEKKKEEKKPKKIPEKAKPKKEPPKKDEDNKKDEADFDSLLKNLAAEEPPQPETEPSETKEDTSPTPAPDTPHLGEQMTMSEMDALRQQLGGCWSVPVGVKDSETLAVEVRIYINADRTVARAEILDQSRYNSDSVFRAAADSALRAVRNPQCSPLNLPADKYDEWKTIVVNFDPKDMS